jgi:ATP-dependent Lhr-like helicase
LSARSGLAEIDLQRGLSQLEAGGFVLRGRFTPGGAAEEVCDRRLLARIHRYTLDRLRRAIEPVSAQDFMRFLLRWHHLTPDTALDGPAGLRAAVGLLQGFEAASGTWESELLPARLADYRAAWLDQLSLSGEVAWARLTPRRSTSNGNGEMSHVGGVATRATPVTLALRADLPVLLAAVRNNGLAPDDTPELGAAGEILALLEGRGALFFDEIVAATRRLPTDVEDGLRRLIGAGAVTSDGFEGLRAVARGGLSSRRRRPRRAGANGFATLGPPGRWSRLAAPPVDPADAGELAERIAEILLGRYGVVFRDLMRRESFTLPWRDILRALRRLEARGLVRGGRFLAGFVGEQYALPQAVGALRRARRDPKTGERVVVGAADPLNLIGIVLPGQRIAAQAGRSIVYRDGLPEAADVGVPKTARPRSIAPAAM